MGYIAHHAVLVTISDYALGGDEPGLVGLADIEQFRQSLPEQFRHLLVGPVQSMVNGYWTLVFLPDGSKEFEWDESDEGDRIRARLIELFAFKYEGGSSPYDVVEIRYGGDDPGRAAITYQNSYAVNTDREH